MDNACTELRFARSMHVISTVVAIAGRERGLLYPRSADVAVWPVCLEMLVRSVMVSARLAGYGRG